MLQENAVTERSELQLEFSTVRRVVPLPKSSRLLQEAKRYEVRVVSRDSSGRRQWRVEGRTQKTTMSGVRLERWIAWMIAVGNECRCDLDRWGTTIPNRRARDRSPKSRRSTRID